ncbi:hypothetical protein J437_LFUL005326 [Ladona fulva]|uniref:Period circadian protein n=1 Tax=Ladona fulva TaxID=123851 RepID=A0A8K0JZF0_LADFU|nr:hypothetical protein J437_LFUL005326 [Ladona fulva]
MYSFLRSEKSDESMRSFPWDSKGDTTENDTKDDVRGSGSKDLEKGNADKHAQKPVRKGPSWLEEVDVTPDLILRYKMDDQILHNVLEADLKTLKNIHQSSTVNEQLSQLYMDMELEGAATRLALEDSAGFTSSSGTDEASVPLNSFSMSPSPTKGKQGFVHRNKKKRRTMEYGKLVMIFEENAPFPPPLSAYSD